MNLYVQKCSEDTYKFITEVNKGCSFIP